MVKKYRLRSFVSIHQLQKGTDDGRERCWNNSVIKKATSEQKMCLFLFPISLDFVLTAIVWKNL